MTYSAAFTNGLLAAKAGKKMLARLQFKQVTELEPNFAPGWLWLAWTADSPQQASDYLDKAVEHSPENRLLSVYREVTLALANYELENDFSRFLENAVTPQVNSKLVSDEVDVTPDHDSNQRAYPIEQPEVEEARIQSDNTKSRYGPHHAEQVASPEEQVKATADDTRPVKVPEGRRGSGRTENRSEDSQSSIAPENKQVPVETTGPCSESDHDQIKTAARAESISRSKYARDDRKTTAKAGNKQFDKSGQQKAAPPHSETVSRDAQLVSDLAEIRDDVETAVAMSPAEPSSQDDVSADKESECDIPTILAVDDSPTVRKLVTMTLKAGGYKVETAENGIVAIKMLKTLSPSLFLLDVNMPRMDGYKLCKLLKRHEKTKDIPVIMLSGKDGMFDKLRGTLVGCDDYISKPFRAAAFLNRIEKHLGPGAHRNESIENAK